MQTLEKSISNRRKELPTRRKKHTAEQQNDGVKLKLHLSSLGWLRWLQTEYLVKEGKKLFSLFFLTCFAYFIYTNRHGLSFGGTKGGTLFGHL